MEINLTNSPTVYKLNIDNGVDADPEYRYETAVTVSAGVNLQSYDINFDEIWDLNDIKTTLNNALLVDIVLARATYQAIDWYVECLIQNIDDHEIEEYEEWNASFLKAIA